MKKPVILALVVLSLSCAKESVNNRPDGQSKRMVALTANNKPNLKLEYNNNLLVKETSFDVCETNPTFEFTYEYQNGRIYKVASNMRGIYSSAIGNCEPVEGVKSEQVFQYNSKGQLEKAITSASTTEYTYNSKGLVEKQAIVSSAGSLISTFEYDIKGNLIKETDGSERITQYSYDDKVNPYYLANQRPQWISAFNKSPNNVIKAKGAISFVRSFKYDRDGYPTEVYEDNGVTYKFEYQ